MELDKRYYINVGPDGTFKPSGDAQYDTTAKHVDALIDKLRADQQQRVLLYFHGGLVGLKSGMEVAERIHRYTAGANVHPVTFVWETGLFNAIGENLSVIHKSKFFKKLLIKIIKIAGKELGVDIDNLLAGSKGIGQMSDEEIARELQKDAPFEATSVDPTKKSASLRLDDETQISDAYIDTVVKNEVEAGLSEEIADDLELIHLAETEKPSEEALLMNPAYSGGVATEGEKGIISLALLIKSAVRITLRVIKRHIRKRDHGFYPTVIEETLREIYINDLGAWVWGAMKDKAKRMWANDDFSGEPEKWHAGSYLLDRLNAYQDEIGSPLTIDLIGHSAGSIAICHLFDAVKERYSGLRFRNLVFMAPACRCELFNQSILQNQELYDHIRVFTMLDDYERKDQLASKLYPRSLLYFISGVLEDGEYDAPILGLQRHITDNAPYDKIPLLQSISHYLEQERRMVYAVTDAAAAEGFRSGSIRHGDFDNDKEATLDSIIAIIKN